MPRDNHNDMDALFRDGAERHDFQYNEDAWAMMDAQLDAADRKRKYLLWFLSGLAVLLISLSSVYLIKDNAQARVEAADIVTSNDLSKLKNDNKAVTKKISSKEKSSDEKLNSQKITSNNEAENAVLSNNILEEKSNTNFSSMTSNAESRYSADEKQSETSPYVASNEKYNERNINYQIGVAVGLDDIRSSNDLQSNAKEEDSQFIKNSTISESRSALATMESIVSKRSTKLEIPRRKEVEVDNVVPTTSKLSSSRWALSLYGAPEYSSIGFTGDKRLGYAFGSKVGYQFADKFEISIGMGYSKKVYSGAGKAYTMEDGWYGNIEPMVMDAKCHIIEFPLALNYFANGYKNDGFFAEVGISSYMLHSEWYGFDYDAALVRPESIVEVVENNENQHLVGVGRIAIGYQKIISDQSTVQVAPYVQFPMTGIGAGQVNLYNMGVQFSLKFNTK